MFCKPGHENITKTDVNIKLNVGLRYGMKMTRTSHKLHKSNVKSNENNLYACLIVSDLIDVVQGYESKLFCELLGLRVSTCLCWVFIDEWRYISSGCHLLASGRAAVSPLC